MRTSVEKVRPESNNFACLGKMIKEKAISKNIKYKSIMPVLAKEKHLKSSNLARL